MGGGVAIASSERKRGFGHSIDHTAPLGSHDTPRTYWQSTHEPPLEEFELHGPVRFAFDGNITTNWWAACGSDAPDCRSHTEWIGLNFAGVPTWNVTRGMKCVRIIQDKDHDYASFSLILQGHNVNTSDWETFTRFNAATWSWGGVWETLRVPQGVAFIASRGHARVLDFNLNSSVVELTGRSLVFDFGV